jgi:DUF3037 family protein
MRKSYSFSILRYVHDALTQEFINVGVALYSSEARFLRALCNSNYGRITRTFDRIDGERYRQLTHYIEDQVNRIGRDLPSELPFDPGLAIETLLARVLPRDDSSFQFSPAGVGLSSNLEGSLGELFDRYVEQYSKVGEADRRSDEEVWRVFREPLDRRHLTAQLRPKMITAPNYEYEFQHAWKNQSWHVCEPISFDLLEAASILDKANRWVGRAISLSESNEDFQIHVLLGEPQDSGLQSAFTKAQNILNKMPEKKEFIKESEAEGFAAQLAGEIEHDIEK